MTDRVVWIDRGWQPAYIGFCPSEKAWKREMRKMGCKVDYPTNPGRTNFFEKEGSTVIIVTLAIDASTNSRLEIAGLICHEATHVWQKVREVMDEHKPSAEFEAYAMQAIFQGLYGAWLDSQ